MSDDFLKERRQCLEEEFFRRQNQQSLDRMKKELQQHNTRDGLRQASGMDNDAVLDKMLEIGLTAETVAALSLVPLIHVAWADGQMQDSESSAILRGAEGKGITKSSPAWDVLSSWLKEPPAPTLFEAWRSYVQAMGKELLNESQFAILKTQIVNFAQGVAEAAGGFLGLGTIAKAEGDALAQIEAAFLL